MKLLQSICKFNIPMSVALLSAWQQKLYIPIKHMAWGTPSCFVYSYNTRIFTGVP